MTPPNTIEGGDKGSSSSRDHAPTTGAATHRGAAPQIRWEPQSGQYTGGGMDCRAGKVVVGRANRAIVSKGDPLVWRPEVLLPGIRLKGVVNFATIEEAKARVESAVKMWLTWFFDGASGGLLSGQDGIVQQPRDAINPVLNPTKDTTP